MGARRQSQRHSDPASQEGFSAYGPAVFAYPVCVFWRLLSGRFACRMADGTDRVQEGHFAGFAHLRGRSISIHPCGFDRAVRLLPFCIVRNGLRAGGTGGRGQPVRYHSWPTGIF